MNIFPEDWTVTSSFQDHLKDPARRGFPGVDYAGTIETWWGKPLYAPEDGDLWQHVDSNGTVYAQLRATESGLDWDFLHMNRVAVVRGVKKRVKAGDYIGDIGNTGFVKPAPTPKSPTSGSHVHISIRENGVFLENTHEIVSDFMSKNEISDENAKKAHEYAEKIKSLSGELQARTEALSSISEEYEKLNQEYNEIEHELARVQGLEETPVFKFVNENSMEAKQSLLSKLGGISAKFLAPSAALSALTTEVLVKNNDLGISAGILSSGLFIVFNILLIVIDEKIVNLE